MHIHCFFARILTIFLTFFLFACEVKPQPVTFPVRGTAQTLYGLSRDAVKGSLSLSGQKKLEYRFEGSVDLAALEEPWSLEIEYSFSAPPGQWQPVLEAAGYSWELPKEGDFGTYTPGSIFHYAIPVNDIFPAYFSIALLNGSSAAAKSSAAATKPPAVMTIHSLEFKRRWLGFYRRQDSSGSHIYASPFISVRPDDSAWVVDPPEAFNVSGSLFPLLAVTPLLPESPPGREIVLEAGALRFRVSPRLEQIIIPAGIIAPNERPFAIPGDRAASFAVSYAHIPLFPVPITADPGIMLVWPQERWRDRRYEVFQWEYFPSLLIFDFANYAIQDRMLKRLAFFVEKAGFRGRLAHDAEIANLHGWNAHDYRAEDLARFYQLAREQNFPLLIEERELERILLANGIIRESGGKTQAGAGGIISVARESPDYLRSRFMAHEGFHGLFFIDEDFRDFSRRRWQQLSAEARRFIISYFDYQRYDTADEYLLINEFMAHVLQQPVSQAAQYFGQALPARIENISWRRADLPAKDAASDSWPSLAAAFTREAEAFSAYINDRWGLAAGRVHLVTVQP